MAEGQVEGLCWRYGQGLRIAGVPHYARGHRLLPLPGTRHWERTTSWEARLANSLRQMVALCGGKLNHCPGARTLRSRTLLAWATDCLPDHQVWLQETPEPQVLLDQARDAIQAGGSALLWSRPERQSPRWMLLAGVQQVWQSEGWGAVQALLALDTATSLVWNCGHNLRLLPVPGAEGIHPAWEFRTLDGGHARGQVGAVLFCHPRVDRPDTLVNLALPCAFI